MANDSGKNALFVVVGLGVRPFIWINLIIVKKIKSGLVNVQAAFFFVGTKHVKLSSAMMNLNWKKIGRFAGAISLLWPVVAWGDVANDSELPGRVAIVRRVIEIRESDCVDVYRGLSCSVRTGLPQLIGPTLSISPRTFSYSAGNQETVVVEFAPSATGYSLTVYPGSADGPYLGYIKRTIRSLPGDFEAIGLKIEPVRSESQGQ